MKLRRILLVITLALFVNISVKAAVGTWIGDYCESCGNYGSAGECDKVHQTTVGIFRVSFYLNGKKLGSSVNVSSNTTYQQNAMNAKWHWGDGKTDIVSYASGTGLGNPTAGGLSSIVISGISTSNVQTVLSPKKNSANVQAVLNQAGITEFKFKDGKIYYVPPKGECEGDYEIQMIVESMQIINWLCNSTGTSSHTWIGTPYELNNGLLAQGYNSHTGGNGYMSGSIVDKDLLSSLRIDKNVKVGNVSFSAVTDCLTTHIRGYAATQGYGFNVYNLTGDFEIECEDECCDPNTDPDHCCKLTSEDDLIATGVDEDGNPVCTPAPEFWKTDEGKNIIEQFCSPKCIPNPSNDYCCDDEEFLNEQPPGYYEEYCMPKDGKCDIPSLKPEYVANYCDNDNENNISYFRDGVFNSTNGQFSDWNKIEDIEKYIIAHKGWLPSDWIDRVVNNYRDNTFLAVAYREDTRYTTKVNDYCNMHCQEIFEVELPDNYPYVHAGRYFKWTIKDSESTIAKAIGGKLCAVDIDLDKAIDKYVEYNQKAQEAADALANTNACGEWYGVKPDIGDLIGAEFDNKKSYLDAIYGNCPPSKACKHVYVSDPNHRHTVYGPCTINGKPSTCLVSEWYDQFYTCDDWWTPWDMTYEDTIRTVYKEGCSSSGGGSATGVETEEYKVSRKIEKYEQYVVGFSDLVFGITNSIDNCNSVGSELEMDMGVELNYQTFFGEKKYSTPDEINKTSGVGVFGSNFSCVNNEDTNDCNQDRHIFALSDRSHKGANPNAIRCDNNGITWYEKEEYPDTSDKGVSGESKESIVYQPIEVYKNEYNSNWVTMLNGIKAYNRNNGYYDSDSLYEYELRWNTIFIGFISNSDLYELNEKINACICKDGEVQNLTDDGCMCEKEVSYKGFTGSYNNYQTLPDGTLKVEFMNPSGLYPISLKYWTIGSVDENGTGHFDSLLTEPSVDGTGHELCGEDGCVYDDPNGMCRLIIKNRIIATPDNNGTCDEPPCDPEPDDNGKCENEPCDPDPDPGDYGDCVYPSDNCKKSNDLNIIYRVIDLDNPFPGTDAGGRSPGLNWIGYEDIIRKNRQVEGSALYNSNVEPLYSMTLTPALIKEIRATNQASASTLGYTSSVAYPAGPAKPGGGYSLFLHRYLEPKDIIKINYDNRDQFSYIQETGGSVK